MVDKVKEMMRVLPKPMALTIRHALLTGLLPSEAVESARLINDKEGAFPKYYDAKQMTLCHYKLGELFLRATKKAYISYITLDNLQPIANLEVLPLPGTPSVTHVGFGTLTWICASAEKYMLLGYINMAAAVSLQKR